MELLHLKPLAESIEELFRNDKLLLDADVNERSLTHKLAEYLQRHYSGWNVDCEYNRKITETKCLDPETIESNDIKGTTIYPDIIVHKRMSDENLLVIEVKKEKNKSNTDNDKVKLKCLTKKDGSFGYDYGFYLVFATDGQKLKSIDFYENGEESDNQSRVRDFFIESGLL